MKIRRRITIRLVFFCLVFLLVAYALISNDTKRSLIQKNKGLSTQIITRAYELDQLIHEYFQTGDQNSRVISFDILLLKHHELISNLANGYINKPLNFGEFIKLVQVIGYFCFSIVTLPPKILQEM